MPAWDVVSLAFFFFRAGVPAGWPRPAGVAGSRAAHVEDGLGQFLGAVTSSLRPLGGEIPAEWVMMTCHRVPS